ncbi:low affinity iron permease family protein [Mesorhizobium retamae]|uniref:Low affinity iron permease family protein n=1 Tax=Mesorhizobium retamae TaxID=2912854 RepID=A0ABS9QGQ3_9HYPH|nr:low affinity iron permease family protein [Mesorhizobium sp. IRAMC:0171]MCG7505941.1 low affinity iron permease family protein [Mesorhizobium sp. IRAMC:0171]
MKSEKIFTQVANAVAHAAGKALTFGLCVLAVLAWAVTGPYFGYSDTWQLIINTSTTIVTFLMVFLIQNTQNRDNAAIQTKLDELIRASEAKNNLIGIEHLTEREVEQLRRQIEQKVAALTASKPLPKQGSSARSG